MNIGNFAFHLSDFETSKCMIITKKGHEKIHVLLSFLRKD